jgi:flagellar motor protein MotB
MIHRLYRPKIDSRSETIWLTVYADLITNKMLVFLALFGLTIMGNDAITRAVQSMKLGEFTALNDGELKFENLAPNLRYTFKANDKVHISEEVGAVRIEFGERALFESGRAIPKASAKEAIQVVADILRSMPHTIVVEGHTDSIPLIPGSLYRDNNELSLARATSIVQMLIKAGLPPDQLAAAAYGSYRPRASNETALGRSINRRVEIALFKDFSYGPRSK